MRGNNKKDWSGIRLGRLTFVQPTEKRTVQGRVVWEALCDCGNTTTTVPCASKAGSARSCGCLAAEQRKACGNKNRKYDPIVSSAKRIWHNSYKDCEFDVFYQFSQLPCHYCGRLPHRTYRGFIYNGMDRIDSSKGHEPGNIVSCCADCNWMKSNRTTEEFVAHIRRVYDHLFTSAVFADCD